MGNRCDPNQPQALALNQGMQKGRKLWSAAGRQQLRELPIMEHAARRRDALLCTVGELDAQIAELDVLVRRQAEGREEARRLAVRLYWMLRREWTYAELARHAGKPGSFRGEQ